MSSYTVKSGDTLWGIAQSQLGNGANWQQLGYTGSPSSLKVGTVLNYNSPASSAAPAASSSSSGSGYNGLNTSAAAPDVSAAYDPYNTDVASTNAARTALISGINDTQNGLYSTYQDTINGQQSLADYYNQLFQSSGAGSLQTALTANQNQIQNLTQQEAATPASTAANAAGTLTDQNQENSINSATEQKYDAQLQSLNAALTPQENAYNNMISSINNQTQLKQVDEQKALQPIQLQIQNFSDQAARTISGFDENTQAQLTGELNKIQSGVQLSTTEWQTAQQNALALAQYNNEFNIAQVQANAAIKAAGISAGGSVSAAKVAAAASTANTNSTNTATLNAQALAAGYPSYDAMMKSYASGQGSVQNQILTQVTGGSLQGAGSSLNDFLPLSASK